MAHTVQTVKSGLIAAVFLGLMSGASFAAGSDSSGSATPPVKTKTSTECKTGEVWDKKTEACIDGKKSSFNDSQLYDAARELAYFGRPDDAIDLLAQMSDQNDPDVLNYLGFANRKAGRVDVGMDYYRQALTLNPDHVLARSYMGQALLEQGDIGAAKEQLVQIRRRAGTVNYAYVQLDQALRGNVTTY